jgi:methionyl-tRNA formyltransferase
MEKWVRNQQADLMITYKVPFLIPQNIFDKPQYGTINIHPSLLPQYRGANPWFWIYYYMELKGGVTIHKVNEYEDHGDILVQDSFPITLGSPLFLLQQEAEKTTINLLNQIFTGWEKIKAIPQEDDSIPIHSKKYFELKKLITLTATDGIRLWHILKGFPFLLKKIYPELEEGYIIGDFVEVYEQNKVGNILYTTEGSYLICCNGSIQIFRN